MVYLFCFAISIFFGYLSQKNKKYLSKFFSFLAILIPSILAGIRATTIGTDVEVYLTVAHRLAKSYSNFFEYSNVLNLEFLYKGMVFFVTKTFQNINVLMFVQHFIICSLFYLGAKNFKYKANPLITYSLFLLMYYNISLNIMRQFMAMSIAFYGFKYIKEENILKYLLCITIATLFHSSAIIALVIYFLYKVCKSKHKYFYSVFILAGLMGVIFLYNPLLKLLVNIGILNGKFLRYSMEFSSFDFNFVDTFIKLYTLFITFLQFKKLKNDKDNFFFTLISIFDITILQVGIFSSQAMRISMYFGIFSLINVSRIITNSEKNKIPLIIITLILYLLYFVMYYIIGGSGETYPYVIGL